MEWYEIGLLIEYFLVLYISSLIYNWVLTWRNLTTPVTRWQYYFKICKDSSKNGINRVSLYLPDYLCGYTDSSASCVCTVPRSVLWNEGIAGRQENMMIVCIYTVCVYLCVFCLYQRKNNYAFDRFPRDPFLCNQSLPKCYLKKLLPFLLLPWLITTHTLRKKITKASINTYMVCCYQNSHFISIQKEVTVDKNCYYSKN